MNKFRFYFILISSISILFSSCKKDDLEELVAAPLNDQAAQSLIDDSLLQKYLETHYIESVSANYDVKISPKSDLPIGTTFVSLLSYLNKPGFPTLKEKLVTISDIKYKTYYLVFREGIANKKPTSVDNVWVAYSGKSIKQIELPGFSGTFVVGTEFETVTYPTQLFSLFNLINGWKEIMPLFGAGTLDESVSTNDPVTFKDYGVGVMFIPSGLAYFNQTRQNIPAYSPLQFTFKLLDMKRSDLDTDGIESINEDLNGNGIYTDDDTDADGIQNYLDFDDDNDGYPTILELKKADGTSYDFLGAPDCTGNAVLTTRIRKYLDPSCH